MILAGFLSDICYCQLYYNVGLSLTVKNWLNKSDHQFLPFLNFRGFGLQGRGKGKGKIE